MQIQVRLCGNKKVAAYFDGLEVITDQPKEDGGEGSGPAPFDLFLASLATCAGFYMQTFCQTRNISTEGISILQSSEWSDTEHRIVKIGIEVSIPSSFPEKYRASLIAAANQCTVKKHLQNPPQLEVVSKII